MTSIDHLWNKKHMSKYTSRGYHGRVDKIKGDMIKFRHASHIPLLRLKILWTKYKVKTAYDIGYNKKEYSV